MGYIPNNVDIGAYCGAISRLDNTTEICSSCGQEEALEDYFEGGVRDWRQDTIVFAYRSQDLD